MDLGQPSKRRRGEELENALLDAAWEQLVDGGFAAFTIDAVAERAHTSRPVIYRRWPDRLALALAALRHTVDRDPVSVPDTGSLREDVIELLRRSNRTRARLIPVVSVQLASYYTETGTTFADVRNAIFGERRPAIDLIIDRAVERGEIDREGITDRVKSLPFDLFRHEVLTTLRPLSEATIIEIVDEVFLPLIRARRT
jgi:AcrR family transcriptional regulator